MSLLAIGFLSGAFSGSIIMTIVLCAFFNNAANRYEGTIEHMREVCREAGLYDGGVDDE
jgi:hypothetical protein